MPVVALQRHHTRRIKETAVMLVEAFRAHYPKAWPTVDSAILEVQESFNDNRISRAAVDDRGHVLGWIGAIRVYDGHVWELHPLVVRPDMQRKGIGRALVLDLEQEVRQRGGITLLVGTDDEDDQTSLAGVDLYPDPLCALSDIRNVNRHPYEFYLKLGFAIVGVVPDANGLGKPDILMAKRIRPLEEEHPIGQQ
ncbi:MAG: GNAT family N-acetyltransferase [Chloroflexota bacterium]